MPYYGNHHIYLCTVKPIKYVRKMKCPVCNNKMVEIVYGMPNVEMREKAKQRKAFIGGCCFCENSPSFHCYKCRKSFSKDLKISVNENDEWLQIWK